MLFKANQAEISEAVKNAVSVVPAKPIFQTHSMFKLIADDGMLVINAVNQENSVRINCPAEVIMGGQVCVDAKNFTKLCSSLSSGMITFDCENNNIKIKTKNQKIEMPTCAPEDFIDFDYNYTESLSIQGEEFLKLISKPAYACSNDSSRIVLNSVLLDVDGSGICCAATDGRRLAISNLPQEVSVAISNNCNTNILQKNIDIIKKIFGKKINKIFHYGETESMFIIETEDLVFAGKKTVGQYPNYQGVIPQECKYKLQINREELLDALALSHVCNQESVGFMICKDGLIHAQTLSADFGSSDIPIDYKSSQEINDDIMIIIDTTFAKEAVNSLTDEEISMEFSDSTSPVVFFDKDTKAIIMPKRA